MSINTDFAKFDNVKGRAQLSNGVIDSPYKFNSNLTKYAKAHINDCKKNPTIGLLARQSEKTNYYPSMAKKNMKNLKKQESFVSLDKDFKEGFKKLYNNTKNIRRQLIKNNSIVLDEVKPIEKNFKRTMIKLFGKLMK